MVLDVGGLSLQTLSGRNSDGERLVGHRSTLLHVREVMVVESVSRWSPRVPCTPRNACHIVRENSRAGKGESGIGCRLSNVGVGPYLRETQRKKSWDRVDYPDKRAYTPEVIWGFEC